MTQPYLLKDKDTAIQLTKSVMEFVVKDQIEQGILLIKPYSAFADHEYDKMLSNFRMQNSIVEPKFGKTIGFELIKVEEKIAGHYS